jgi:general secretion pathway protein H
MPTLAPGSPELRRPSPRPGQPQRGFTLLELLVVVSIVALATAGVSLSLRDASATQLEREAQRLVALLESARAQSRTRGVPVFWQPGERGFELDGQFRPWLAAGTVVGARQAGASTSAAAPTAMATTSGEPLRVALGPEPLMAPQQLSLSLQGRTLWLVTDGLRPFAVSSDPSQPTQPTSVRAAAP